MRKVVIVLSVFTLIVLSCNQATKQQQTETANNEKIVSEEEKEIVFNNDETLFPLIGNTIGFISFDFEKWFAEERGTFDRIEILNDNGNSWLSAYVSDFIEYTNGDVNISAHNNYENFRPWAFEPGIGVFTIRCIAKSETDYTIVVNEEKNIVKRLKEHDIFKFQSLEEHVSNRLVGTDFDLNPIREFPSDDAPIVLATEDEIELTVSIELKGDWIKIEDSYNDKVLGWIRWKKGDRFMVQLYYSV